MIEEDDDAPISAEELFKDCFGDLPDWAIHLGGLRFRENLTQVQLAEILGIPQPNISKMESGKRPIGKKLAKKLADFFHTDYRMFL